MSTKIFMVTMAMDIGGAETHILELSKKLHEIGYDVIVASNGGTFVEQLEADNIKHYKVPLNDRNIFNIIKSYKMLKEIIIKEKVDIVHAHARIPAFVCSLLKKKLGFKFVTTTHGIYKTSFPLNVLTNWGEKTLAVSEDVKKYLINDYNLPQDQIKMTINGINPQVFDEDLVIKTDSIIKRFSDSFNILHVTRLEDDTSLTAETLIKNAYELFQKNNNIKIIIVGGGKSYDELKNMADLQNKKIGKDVIFLEGPKTNVNEYVKIANIFVGISRAALEAMIMRKNTILSGNFGYMGIFDESKLEEAKLNNFTCRGSDKFDDKRFFSDIIKLMEMDDNKKQELADFGKQVVIDGYSVNRMVYDAIDVYNSVLQNDGLKLLVFGYIGFNNSGDDAIFDVFSNMFVKKHPNAEITALSNSESFRLSENPNVKSAYCFNLFEIIKQIKNNQIILANGGSLLQDSTSSRSLYYYLSIILIAKLFKKKTVMLANGLGPIRKSFNKMLVKKIVNKVDLITFRDEESYEFAKKLGITSPNSYVTADMVFNYKGLDKKNTAKTIFEQEGIPCDKKLIGLSIRPWGSSDKYVADIARLCDKLIEGQNVDILFIPMQQTKRVDDITINKQIIDKMQHKAYMLSKIYNYKDINSVISKMEVMICMRLHSVIYALLNNIPVYGLAYQSKVRTYLEEIKLPVDSDLNNLNVDRIYKESVRLMHNKELLAGNIDKKLVELENKAHMNLTILDEHINKWF